MSREPEHFKNFNNEPVSSVYQRPRRCSRPTPQNRNRRSCEKHMELTQPLTSTLHISFIPKLSAPSCVKYLRKQT